MGPGRVWMAPVVTLALVATSCTGGTEPPPTPSLAPAPKGGTLRIVSPDFVDSGLQQPAGPDPQKDYFSDSWELFRCCLLRTLLSNRGAPTSEGGAILRPDLAASMPTVSPDGRTWTFRLRPGLHYAPPLQRVEIKAQDFIRAMEREANPEVSASGYSFYYSVIEGFDDFAAGETDSISGLEAPDEHTLQVHLVRPTGDLGGRLAMPAAAPIPPNPSDPSAPLGVASGHDDRYGPFLVSSGPYRLEGSEAIDFSLPPARQRPASGLVPGRSVTLVRNPSWDPSTDHLRGAYVDRMDFSFGGTVEEAAAAVDGGRADLVFYPGPPPQAPPEQVRRYQADPAKGTVSIESWDLIDYASLNLALPPLDDIHVRKAMNLIVDKTRLQEILGGPTASGVIGHVGLNSLENDLLLDYDPYGTPGHSGSLKRAREEMALSAYDTNGDGLCDASVCSDLPAVGFNQFPSFVSMAKQIQKDLVEIGIHLDVQLLPFKPGFPKIYDPKSHVALALTLPWGKDYLNASTFFVPLFAAASISGPNHALVGATPQQLRRWGYAVTSVPSVDERIHSCLVEVGQAQLRCWVELDQYLMESVVPWIPFQILQHVDVVPARVVRYSYDQFGNLPALDQIALERAR